MSVRVWRNSVSGDTWLGVAFAVCVLSLMSGFFSVAAGFNFDPDDHSSDYYAAQIPMLVAVLVVSVLIPAASAAASVLSILARPRSRWRMLPSTIVLLLALSVGCFCCENGIEAIRQAADFAAHSPK